LFLQILEVRDSQIGVLNLARRVEQAEKEMKRLLPELNEGTQLYANHFILSVPYFLPTASVWYDRPDLQGGTFEVLKNKSIITEDYYVFDYDEDGLYNLMPELQRHKQTLLVWRRPPVVANWLQSNSQGALESEAYQVELVAGPAGDRRLAIKVLSLDGRWTSIGFASRIPRTSRFAVATLGALNHTFRVRLVDEVGSEHLLFESTVQADRAGKWQDFIIPVTLFGNQSVNILLEHQCIGVFQDDPGYWANPRLVID